MDERFAGRNIGAHKHIKNFVGFLSIGEKEEKENTVSVNARDKKEQEVLLVGKFIEKILKEIGEKK